jgi:hypothetical protein
MKTALREAQTHQDLAQKFSKQNSQYSALHTPKTANKNEPGFGLGRPTPYLSTAFIFGNF